MTERLYYTDPHPLDFEANVLAVEPANHRIRVRLDRTAFYPTSGGQPFDMGVLDEQPVVDVIEDEQGNVWHLVEAERAPTVGTRVRGRVDWPRRFDHMQQHTGQHVLSAAFDRLHHAATVAFHLGGASCTIDLDREVADAAVRSAEAEANRVIWENRSVAVRFLDREKAAGLPLRKEPARTGLLRLIEIGDFDLSACGGTHVSRTGAIGVVAVIGHERFKRGLRIEFVCGGRALTRFQLLRDVLARATRQLSVSAAELPDALERLQEEHRNLRRTVRGLQERLTGYEAAALAATATPVGAALLVAATVEADDPAMLKSLGVSIVERPGHAAVLFSRGSPAIVAVARSADVNLDVAAVVRRLTDRFGGRGGGKPDLAQAGGLVGSVDDLVGLAKDIVSQALTNQGG